MWDAEQFEFICGSSNLRIEIKYMYVYQNPQIAFLCTKHFGTAYTSEGLKVSPFF